MSSKDLDSQLVSIITKARQEYSRSWTKLTEEEFVAKQILKTDFVPPNEAEWQDVPNLYLVNGVLIVIDLCIMTTISMKKIRSVHINIVHFVVV